MGIVVDGLEGDGRGPKDADAPPAPPVIDLGGGLTGEMDCPSCFSPVRLTGLRSSDCPSCGAALGVALGPAKDPADDAGPDGGPVFPDEEAVLGMDDEDDWSAPSLGLGDDFEDGDWDDGDDEDGELKGETVDMLFEEEEWENI